MTEDTFDLSRRKVLGSLGAIGVASAGAGLGTSAYFSDEESFTSNTLTAGELDLVVDYETSVSQGGANTGSTTGSGTIDDNPAEMQYDIDDVKPGDSGSLRFCPKVVDNDGWIFVGSSGLTDFENGLTDPENEVDDTPHEGELSENIQVTVSYCDENSENKRELNNPDDYTLADLFLDLRTGFLLDGDTDTDGKQPYPGSTDDNNNNNNNGPEQQGPCICIDWEIPTDVGNEIQGDSVKFGVEFVAIQSRHNEDPDQANPFADGVATADYFNPSGHNDPTDGTLVASVNFGDDLVVLGFEFQDDDDGLDFADTSDYSNTNLPVMIDADDNGNTDFQLIWNPNSSNVDPLASAPFAKREHDNTDGSPGSYVTLPNDYSAVKAGNRIAFGVPRSELGSSFKLSTWGSTGGEGPVVEISTDSDNSPNFTDSTNYVTFSES
jgi:predicted ribosomally synthesized peptide with SipW-like signal peptide